MKILILLLSTFLIFSYGCNGGDPIETETEGLEVTDDNKDEDIVIPTPTITNPSQNDNSPEGTVETTTVEDPCTSYINNCTTLQECSDKYNNCLKPKAGEPTTKQVVTCKKQDSEDILLKVNEWDSESGKNNLLCEFFENKDLYRFATKNKNICKDEMNKRKQELINSGYTCE